MMPTNEELLKNSVTLVSQKYQQSTYFKHYFKVENENDGTYCSWLPNNFGYIAFDLIANELYANEKTRAIYKNPNEKTIKYIDIKPELSDSMALNLPDLYRVLPKQLKPVITIVLEELSDGYSGDISINLLTKIEYFLVKEKIKEFNKQFKQDISKIDALIARIRWKSGNNANNMTSPLEFASSFNLCTNGYIELLKIRASSIVVKDENNIDKCEIKTHLIGLSAINQKKWNELLADNFAFIPKALYTAIKRMIHFDNHHHTKIDTIIPVQKDKLIIEDVLHSMGMHLKNIDVKLRHAKSVEPECGYSKSADGVMAYIETFSTLFIVLKKIIIKFFNKNIYNFYIVKS